MIEQNLEASKFEVNNNISRYEKRIKVRGLSWVDMEYISEWSLKCHSFDEIHLITVFSRNLRNVITLLIYRLMCAYLIYH